MPSQPTSRRRNFLQFLAAGAAAGFLVRPAEAHHGWNWAVDEQSELQGTIHSISMAPPHPSLVVTAANGVAWQIDLGNPTQTERSGFSAATANPGDAITVLGNRHRDPSKLQMKAVRITLAGKNFDMYPERIKK